VRRETANDKRETSNVKRQTLPVSVVQISLLFAGMMVNISFAAIVNYNFISMALGTALAGELNHEAAGTRKLLSRIPEDKLDWKPHDKSMPLGRLACHVAELPQWVKLILEQDAFNMVPGAFNRLKAATTEELLQQFDERIQEAADMLSETADERFQTKWSFVKNGVAAYELPRKIAVRQMVMNHIVHHRAQLTVYLRLLNVPVPGLYGPSADEQ